MKLTVKLRQHARRDRRGVLIPIDGESLLHVVKYLRELVLRGGLPERGEQRAAARAAVHSERETQDRGKVIWLFGQNSFLITYRDSQGKAHQTCKDLKVNREDHLGRTLAITQFKEAKDTMLLKARKLWNELDKSDAARYPS